MKLRVQFYAQLRHLAGVPSLDVDLAVGAAVSDLLEKVYEEIPVLRAQDKNILVGAGLEFVDRKFKLKSGDEISVMPPVQGG